MWLVDHNDTITLTISDKIIFFSPCSIFYDGRNDGLKKSGEREFNHGEIGKENWTWKQRNP